MQRSTAFCKIAEPILAIIAVSNLLEMSAILLPLSIFLHLTKYLVPFVDVSMVLAIGFGITYGIAWIKRDNPVDTARRHARLRGLLRYWLAFSVSVYGFAKVFKTQFGALYTRGDIPVGRLNGFELTWNYFAHSYPMALFIAGLQIGGSFLLLWRRTSLLGVVVLLPVMMNIMLINLFYHIAVGAFINSILYSLGLTYLLLLRREELVTVFLPAPDGPPVIASRILDCLLKVSAIAVPFAMIYLAVQRNPISHFAGKWRVECLVRNRDTLHSKDWESNPKAWTTVYIEEHGVLAFCANPYIFDNQRARLERFEYDTSLHRLRMVVAGQDSLIVTVTGYNGTRMRWDGLFGKDTIMLQLAKVERQLPKENY